MTLIIDSRGVYNFTRRRFYLFLVSCVDDDVPMYQIFFGSCSRPMTVTRQVGRIQRHWPRRVHKNNQLLPFILCNCNVYWPVAIIYNSFLTFFCEEGSNCIKPRFLQKSPDNRRNYKEVHAELWRRLRRTGRCAGETCRFSSASLD